MSAGSAQFSPSLWCRCQGLASGRYGVNVASSGAVLSCGGAAVPLTFSFIYCHARIFASLPVLIIGFELMMLFFSMHMADNMLCSDICMNLVHKLCAASNRINTCIFCCTRPTDFPPMLLTESPVQWSQLRQLQVNTVVAFEFITAVVVLTVFSGLVYGVPYLDH